MTWAMPLISMRACYSAPTLNTSASTSAVRASGGAGERERDPRIAREILEREGGTPAPARIPIEIDAGEIHRIDDAGEVVEGDAGERRRRATEERMQRAAKAGIGAVRRVAGAPESGVDEQT